MLNACMYLSNNSGYFEKHEPQRCCWIDEKGRAIIAAISRNTDRKGAAGYDEKGRGEAVKYLREEDIVEYYSQYLALYKRFVDAIFAIWCGPKDILLEFLDAL